jgi:CHAD domain-containing protein
MAVESLHEYAVHAIRERLERTAGLIDAVRSGDDPQTIKKMRVNSRRLRAALQVFEPGFPSKAFARFERDVKTVADALAEARDLDVIIDTVTKAAEPIPPDERGWIDSFLERQQHERSRLRDRVLKAVGLAEKRDLLGKFEELVFIQELKSDAADTSDGSDKSDGTDQSDTWSSADTSDSIAESFGPAITGRMAELLAFEPVIEDPAQVVELHKMRIAGKRLRYTLELYVAHTGDRLLTSIERMKTIQDYLGNIHDIDVLVPLLQAHLISCLNATKGAGEIAGAYITDFGAAEGMAKFCRIKRAEREQAYRDFLVEWRKMRMDGYFDSLWSLVRS